MDAAYCHAQPVTARLFHKAHRPVYLGEAHLPGKNLFVGDGLLAGLVAHHGAQLCLNGHARLMSDLRGSFGGGDVALQGQAASVHHHGLIARLDGAADDGQVVHLQVVLIHHGNVVQVQQGIARLLVLAV